MTQIRFQLDEDCQARSLAGALKSHGIDVVTTNEAGLSGISDEQQLLAATRAQRVLVTNNIRDFVPLHARWLAEDMPPHSGVVLFHQQELSLAETVRRLSLFSRTLAPAAMTNRLEWLSPWAAR